MLSTWTRRRTLGVTAVLLLAPWLLVWQVADPSAAAPQTRQATEQQEPGDAGATGEPGEPGEMVLVLDSSGSMKQPASGGQTKIAAAKDALRRVIASLPPDQAVGLRVYGAEVFSADEPGACQDSQLVVPVETGNRAELREALTDYRPYGETPIGYALQQAAEDLGEDGKRTIVLVSDGEPTCDPDPCQVAKELARKGVDLRVDVVGLDVDGQAQEALQCIARAGHGTYYDVTSAEQLAASLEKLATRAARPYSEIGQAVEGSADPEAAPVITEGDWLDTIGGENPTRYYRVERSLAGSALHVSAAFRNPGGTAFNRVELTTPDGSTCDADGSVNQLQPGMLTSTASTAGPYGLSEADYDDPCVTSPTILAKVNYEGSQEVPLEIRVLEEPKVADVDALPEPVEEISWAAPGTTAPTKVVGGSSFADAAQIEPGSYRGTIVPGEVLTYAVEVGYGQQLSAAVTYPRFDGKLAEALRGGLITQVEAFSPARAPAAASTEGHFPKSWLDSNGTEIGFATAPVAFSNLSASGPTAAASVPGRYVVTLFVEEDPDGSDYLVPFRLDVGVSGDLAEGPTFVEEPIAAASPRPTAPETTPPPSPQGSEDAVEAAAASDEGGLSAGAVVGGLGAVALLAGAYLAISARRRGAG